MKSSTFLRLLADEMDQNDGNVTKDFLKDMVKHVQVKKPKANGKKFNRQMINRVSTSVTRNTFYGD